MRATTIANLLNFKFHNQAILIISELSRLAGITINGSKPWDIQIHSTEFYTRILQAGELALGETYVEKLWDCQRIDMFIEKLVNADIENKIKKSLKLKIKLLLTRIINFQTKKRGFELGRKHYDLSNGLFTAMLDSEMNYTCGYWKNVMTLDQAQLAKLDLVCQKLQLKPGMQLLDIGCGWGALAKYAVEKYDVSVVGITISKEQYQLAKKRCAELPIEIRLQDYRDVNEQYDRIVSLGMFEHVGHLNYRQYMRVVHRCLADEGLFLLHTIGSNETTTTSTEWITKYIFPNGMLPSITQIGKATEKLFIMEDWHNFGADYDKTLMMWQQNFNKNWGKLATQYDEYFYRMWNYYLLYCAGGFRGRAMQLWQIVFSKKGIKGGYVAPR